MFKKIISISLLVAALACNNDIKKENERLRDENQELSQEKKYQDSTINDFALAFETIQENLQEIRKREEAIREMRSGGIEATPALKDQIITDVEAINELLEENRKTIASLNEKVSREGREVRQLEKLINGMRQQISRKDSAISRLKQDLSSMNFKMAQLNSKVGSLTEEKLAQRKKIQDQEQKLNTAYYAIGTEDELKENNVIDKEGGFMWIGRTKTLAENFNKEYFTRVNKQKTTRLPIDHDGKKLELITNHPSDSYEWEENEEGVNALKITDPEAFWKTSPFLVVLVK